MSDNDSKPTKINNEQARQDDGIDITPRVGEVADISFGEVLSGDNRQTSYDAITSSHNAEASWENDTAGSSFKEGLEKYGGDESLVNRFINDYEQTKVGVEPWQNDPTATSFEERLKELGGGEGLISQTFEDGSQPLAIAKFMDMVTMAGGMDSHELAIANGFSGTEEMIAKGFGEFPEETRALIADGDITPKDWLITLVDSGKLEIQKDLDENGGFSIVRNSDTDFQAMSLLEEYDVPATDENITALLVADISVQKSGVMNTASYESAADYFENKEPISPVMDPSPTEVSGTFNDAMVGPPAPIEVIVSPELESPEGAPIHYKGMGQ